MSKKTVDDDLSNNTDELTLANKSSVEVDSTEESSLLNSIVEAVMRGDMNQVVTLALSHRSGDPKVKTMVDQALSSAISNKARLADAKVRRIVTIALPHDIPLCEFLQDDDVTLTEDTADIFVQNSGKSIDDVQQLESSVAKSPATNKSVFLFVVTTMPRFGIWSGLSGGYMQLPAYMGLEGCDGGAWLLIIVGFQRV